MEQDSLTGWGASGSVVSSPVGCGRSFLENFLNVTERFWRIENPTLELRRYAEILLKVLKVSIRENRRF